MNQTTVAKHHVIPRSRNGPDNEWNLVELSDYNHAYGHALDFVLFDSAPVFDCRQPGWQLLPDDLRQAVRRKLSERMKGNQHAVGYGGPPGERNGNFGKAPCLGRVRPPEERARISAAHKGKPKSEGHRRSLSKAKMGKKTGPQGPEARRNKSIGAKKGWETRDKERLRKHMKENNPGNVRASCIFCKKETTKSSLTQFHKNCKPQ